MICGQTNLPRKTSTGAEIIKPIGKIYTKAILAGPLKISPGNRAARKTLSKSRPAPVAVIVQKETEAMINKSANTKIIAITERNKNTPISKNDGAIICFENIYHHNNTTEIDDATISKASIILKLV